MLGILLVKFKPSFNVATTFGLTTKSVNVCALLSLINTSIEIGPIKLSVTVNTLEETSVPLTVNETVELPTISNTGLYATSASPGSFSAHN